MKRVLVFIMALLYFTVSSGLAMSVHYCMGEISSVEVNHNSNDPCICGMSKQQTAKKGCCRTEFTMIKLDDTHKASSVIYEIQSPEMILPRPISLIDVPVIPAAEPEYADVQGPPLLSEQDTYLFNCVFRI